MAVIRSLFSTALLLLSSSLIIASATDYGYGPEPEVDQKKPKEDFKFSKIHKPKPEKAVELPEISTPKIEVVPQDYKPKPEEDVKYPEVGKPKPEDVKHPGVDKAKPEEYTGHPKVRKQIPEADVEYPKVSGPKSDEANTIGVEGLIICRSGSKYFPIQGAVARITCLGMNEYGYETAPFSILSGITDSKGYFFVKLCPQLDSKLKITECKAFLESSPLDTCKVATDVNKGISGALLSSYRILNDHKIKLHTLGPFFYTSEAKTTPGGY